MKKCVCILGHYSDPKYFAVGKIYTYRCVDINMIHPRYRIYCNNLHMDSLYEEDFLRHFKDVKKLREEKLKSILKIG